MSISEWISNYSFRAVCVLATTKDCRQACCMSACMHMESVACQIQLGQKLAKDVDLNNPPKVLMQIYFSFALKYTECSQ